MTTLMPLYLANKKALGKLSFFTNFYNQERINEKLLWDSGSSTKRPHIHYTILKQCII